MKDQLYQLIENNLLQINSTDSALSVSRKDLKSDLSIIVYVNNVDSETIVITNIINSINNFYLQNCIIRDEDFSYTINVLIEDECNIISFDIADLLNF